VAIIAAGLLPSVPAAQAADNGIWAVTPVQKGSSASAQRQFFFFELSEGQTIRDAITIENPSDTDLTLSVYPADAFNVPDGAGFSLKRKDDEQNDVGSWVTMARSTVSVPANGGKVNVPYTMTVPRGATPGDHAGGIVTLEPEPPDSPIGESSQVKVQRALGVRIYVRIAGPLTPSLTVTEVRLDVQPARLPFIGRQGGATVSYTVRNSGNVRITADRLTTLDGLFGRTLHSSGSGPIPEILPGSTVFLRDSFPGMPVLDRVTARVEVTDGATDIESAGEAQAWSVSPVFLFAVLALLLVLAVVIGRASKRRARDQRSSSAETSAVEEPFLP
jgi:hypothetical protein